MSAPLTEAEFSKHVNTKFRLAGEKGVDLELVAVNCYLSRPDEHTGMERFSIFFIGPSEPFLEQKIYSLEHEQMGAIDLFLVPVAQAERGIRYEAVFNYFQQQ
jgi:Domain of unknown function (DUF6916)